MLVLMQAQNQPDLAGELAQISKRYRANLSGSLKLVSG